MPSPESNTGGDSSDLHNRPAAVGLPSGHYRPGDITLAHGTTNGHVETPDSFRILYFATAFSYTGKEGEDLPAPLEIGRLFAYLDSKYEGMREKVLWTCKVSVNWEYVDLREDADRLIQPGDEVGILPPVSAG